MITSFIQNMSTKAFRTLVISLSIAIVASLIFEITYFTLTTVDFVHSDGPLSPLAASMSKKRDDGYAYHFTNPEYFEGRNWTSTEWQDDITSANNDGTLGRWSIRWYMSHSDSGYGQEILKMKLNDHVTIDGVEYVIEGFGITHQGSAAKEVVDLTNNADLILMTCTEKIPAPGEPHEELVVWGRFAD